MSAETSAHLNSDAVSENAAGRMDAIYRHQRHIYDLTRKFYLLGRDRLIADLNPPAGGSVLEVGCGTGRNLIVAGRRYKNVALYGIDISAEMLATARKNAHQSGLVTRMALARADASDFSPNLLFGQPKFDRIFLSYTLSMIPPWRETLFHLAQMLAPGGSLHLVDFGQQEGLPPLFRKALFAWLDRFDVCPREHLHGAWANMAEAAGLNLEFQPLFRGYAWSGVASEPA